MKGREEFLYFKKKKNGELSCCFEVTKDFLPSHSDKGGRGSITKEEEIEIDIPEGTSKNVLIARESR